MGCLTAAAGQRCEQVKVPPQARGSQWKTRGIRKYKSDVSAVKFPANLLSGPCPNASCMAAAVLVPCAGSSGLPFMPRSLQGSIMHLYVFLKIGTIWTTTWMSFFSCTASHMICQLVFVIWREGYVRKVVRSGTGFLHKQCHWQNFYLDLIDFCTSSETCDTSSEELPKSVSTSNRAKFIPLKE